MKVSLIVNESKGKARSLAHKFCAFVEGPEHEVEILGTESLGHAIELSTNAATTADLIVAVGGDGTINECVNGIMKAQSQCALSVLPAGTGNDFVRSFAFPNSPELLAKALQNPQFVTVDTGLIEYTDSSEYFINISDAGLGPTVIKRMMREPSWYPAGLKFNSAIIKTLPGYKRPVLKCKGENFEWQGEALVIAVANGKYFASGLGVAPMAKLDDGQFQIFIAGDISIMDYVRNIPKLKKAQIIDHPGLHYFTSPWLEISGDSSMEKDGELGKDLPCKVSCVPSSIRLLSA